MAPVGIFALQAHKSLGKKCPSGQEGMEQIYVGFFKGDYLRHCGGHHGMAAYQQYRAFDTGGAAAAL